MDEVVKRAMLKWPDVPTVCGWLRLDRRGNWLVRDATGAFGRIGNQSIVDFIGRNYHADERGRWYFQNGPQRVYVALDYTPYIYRVAPATGTALSVAAHSGATTGDTRTAYIDDAGQMLLDTTLGIGLVHDTDLELLIPRFRDGGSAPDETALAAALDAAGVPCGPVYNYRQMFEDPQVRHRETVVESVHPLAGKINLAGSY